MSSSLHISASRLLHNVAAIERLLGGSSALLAVIKANAYGHGATLCAPILARAGVPWLGVTNAHEGTAVRAALNAAGFPHDSPRILIMTAPPGDAASAEAAAGLALRHDLTPTVYTPAHLGPLAEAAFHSPDALAIHLEIDSGMCRQGAAPGAPLEGFLSALSHYPTLRLEALSTHLASAEYTDARQSLQQMEAFERSFEQLAYPRPCLPTLLHIGNASTLDNGSAAAAPILARLKAAASYLSADSMVRCGLGLYGLCLPLDPGPEADARLRPSLQPVLSWTTTITTVSEVAAGARIGYSATYTAARPMRLALLPIGYADGLRRELSSSNTRPGGWVMIHGQRAPIVGRISMNLTTVDVTEIAGAEPGEAVTLLGEGITAEDHARLAGTIPYEILCGLRGIHTES
jgi:alanine racemase